MIKIDWWMGMMMDDTPKIFFFLPTFQNLFYFLCAAQKNCVPRLISSYKK